MIDRIWRKLYRLLRNRQFFIVRLRPSWARFLSILLGLGRAVVHPAELPALWKFVRNTLALKSARFHYIAVQSPPEVDDKRDRLQLCYQCPDATIRNGRLTPVCLADRMSPLGSRQPLPSVLSENIMRSVYRHLEAC